MKKVDVLISFVGIVGALAAVTFTAHDYGYDRGFATARYQCPPQQNGERLRFVEQPANADRVVCIYARVSGTANRRAEQ